MFQNHNCILILSLSYGFEMKKKNKKTAASALHVKARVVFFILEACCVIFVENLSEINKSNALAN